MALESLHIFYEKSVLYKIALTHQIIQRNDLEREYVFNVIENSHYNLCCRIFGIIVSQLFLFFIPQDSHAP